MRDDVTREPEGVPGGWVAAAVVALIVFVWLCAGVLWLAYPTVRNPQMAPPAAFGGPGLEVAPVADFKAYMAQ
jgi:hypothetical protein